MAKERITPEHVATFTKAGKYPCGGGLYLQVTGTRARSWYFRTTVKDADSGVTKERYIGLGTADGDGAVSLDEARQKAAELKEVRDAGSDPLARKRATQEEKARLEAAKDEQARIEALRHGFTFKQAAEEFIKTRTAGLSNVKHAASYTASMARYVFPVIGDRPVASIEAADIADVIAPILHDKPETARRLLQRLRRVFAQEKARRRYQGENPANPDLMEDMLHLKQASKARKKEHFAALPFEDVPRLYSSLEAKASIGHLCLRFLILTCVRSHEARGALWSEFDFKGNVWIIPPERMKMRREHRVPLSPAVLEVLGEAAKFRADDETGTGLVFPSERKGGVLSDMTLSMIVRRYEGCETTVHGLRSSFRDWAAEKTNHENHVCEMALAHVVPGVEGAYRRGALFDKRRVLMNDWAKFVVKPAKVFRPIKRASRAVKGMAAS